MSRIGTRMSSVVPTVLLIVVSLAVGRAMVLPPPVAAQADTYFWRFDETICVPYDTPFVIWLYGQAHLTVLPGGGEIGVVDYTYEAIWATDVVYAPDGSIESCRATEPWQVSQVQDIVTPNGVETRIEFDINLWDGQTITCHGHFTFAKGEPVNDGYQCRTT